MCTDTPDVMQDMLKPGKDLSNAMTVGFLATQQKNLYTANRVGFGLGLLGWALIQAQKTGKAFEAAKKMLPRHTDVASKSVWLIHHMANGLFQKLHAIGFSGVL